MTVLHLTTSIAKIKKRMRTPNVGEDVEWLELSYTRGGSIKYYNHFRKRAVSYKITHLPYGLVTSTPKRNENTCP